MRKSATSDFFFLIVNCSWQHGDSFSVFSLLLLQLWPYIYTLYVYYILYTVYIQKSLKWECEEFGCKLQRRFTYSLRVTACLSCWSILSHLHILHMAAFICCLLLILRPRTPWGRNWVSELSSAAVHSEDYKKQQWCELEQKYRQ